MATAEISFCWSLTAVVVLSNKPPPIKEIYNGWSLESQSRQKFPNGGKARLRVSLHLQTPGAVGVNPKTRSPGKRAHRHF